jgi:hypothetical protein
MDFVTLLSPPPVTVPDSLRLILRGLMAVLGNWLDGGQAIAFHRRISTLAGRVERMLQRLRAGTLRRMPPRAMTQRAERKARRKPAVSLPRTFGWLLRTGKHHAAGYGSQLRAQLETPEMVELLAVSPQAVRILRPLCRALAVELPWVNPPRKPREKKPRKPRRRTYAVTSDFNPPMPRGMLAWARKNGCGKRPPD